MSGGRESRNRARCPLLADDRDTTDSSQRFSNSNAACATRAASSALSLRDHHGDLDLRRADQLDVHAGFGERLKERRGDAAVRLHADAHDREFRDVLVHGYASPPTSFSAGSSAFTALAFSVSGTVNVRFATPARPTFCTIMSTLMCAFASALKTLRGRAGLVGDVADDDLGLVLVDGDAADDDLFHVGDFLFHDGSWVVVKGGADFENDVVLGRKFDRARLHDLAAERGELEHLVVADFRRASCAVLHHARIGGVDAVHVGVDLALVRLDRRGERDGGEIRAAAAERGDLAVIVDALEIRRR